MSATKELINAISIGDSVGIESAFNTAMAEKISAKLDDMRQSVAQNMFATEETIEESVEELEEEQLDELTGKGKLDSIAAAHKDAGDKAASKASTMKSDSGFLKHDAKAVHHYAQAARAKALKAGDRDHAKEIDTLGKNKSSAYERGETPQGKKIDYKRTAASINAQR